MNKDQANGKWKQLKGTVKRAWGRLTGNNAEKAEGLRDEFFGVVQEKVGDAKAHIKEKLDRFWVNASKRNQAVEKPDKRGTQLSPRVIGKRRSICCG
jgi:uncharacterized protein YjbJ (UPF0337 family)